jgi:hypothetical protein
MNEINKIDSQIETLLVQKESIKASNFKKASSNWFDLLQIEYESSSSKTPEYLVFCRVFKKQFTKLLKGNFEIHKIDYGKSQCHFGFSGFFQLVNGQIWYFSIGDLRWDKSFLIRKADSFTDYTGKTNQFCETKADLERFINDLNQIVNNVSFQVI